jgi:hypothetical protein
MEAVHSLDFEYGSCVTTCVCGAQPALRSEADEENAVELALLNSNEDDNSVAPPQTRSDNKKRSKVAFFRVGMVGFCLGDLFAYTTARWHDLQRLRGHYRVVPGFCGWGRVGCGYTAH